MAGRWFASMELGPRSLRWASIALCTFGLTACSVSGPGHLQPGTNQSPAQQTDSATPGTASADLSPATGPAKRQREPVKVGLLLPLSGQGQTAVLAEMMKKAAELAITDHDATHVQLLVRDDQGTPEVAKTASEELIGNGAEIILGPLFAKSVTAAASSARAAKVPLLAFSTDRQVAGQGTHLISFLVGPEVQRVVAYAAARGKKRFAALIPDDPLGKLTETSFREAVAKSGGTIVALELYPAQPNGMVEPVQRLRDAMRGIEEHGDAIDALFVPGGEDVLVSLGPLLKKEGIDPAKIRLIGTGGLDYPNAGRDAILVGAWFAGPDPRGWKDFSEKFAKAHGHAPPRIASLAYDAASLAIALSAGQRGTRYNQQVLLRPSGFTGVDGAFRLSHDGTTERGLAVLEVQKFGATVIDNAPTSLAPG